ncbi:MAG: RNA-binding domain protein [Gammaproteobacteria bacterium]|jgi:23S rRNA pseudouridine2605 synthase|nr:RNA-binding domain protein [Gammaproteobacteria bacterium]
MAERIQKFLAQLGLASRRQIEQWIKEQRITVNGELVSLGAKVESTDRICLDNKAIKTKAADEETHILLYHKPIGEVCTRQDPEGRNTVFDNLPSLAQGRWVVVGRLDYNTSGLLLFSNKGELVNKLAHPRYGFEREYRVRVYGEVSAEIIHRLLEGVQLEDGLAAFKTIIPGLQRGRNQWFKVTLAEGRNRIVRRLWASQGLVVNRLERIRFGPIRLPADLEVGEYRFLTKIEVEQLFHANNPL